MWYNTVTTVARTLTLDTSYLSSG